jgi:hypothetical protein
MLDDQTSLKISTDILMLDDQTSLKISTAFLMLDDLYNFDSDPGLPNVFNC